MAQQTTKDVKSKGEVVGQVTLTIFDDLDEITDELEEPVIVGYVNRCRVIDALDAKRREVTGGVTAGLSAVIRAAREKAKEDPALLEKIKALLGEV